MQSCQEMTQQIAQMLDDVSISYTQDLDQMVETLNAEISHQLERMRDNIK